MVEKINYQSLLSKMFSKDFSVCLRRLILTTTGQKPVEPSVKPSLVFRLPYSGVLSDTSLDQTCDCDEPNKVPGRHFQMMYLHRILNLPRPEPFQRFLNLVPS